MSEHAAENDAGPCSDPVPVEHTHGALPDHCPTCAFTQNTHSAHVLWEAVKNATQRAVDAALGTDPRHGLLARAVADEVAFGKPLPWNLASHFGRVIPPAETAAAREGEGR